MTALTVKYEAEFSDQEKKMGRINFKSDMKQYIELDDTMNSTITGPNDMNMMHPQLLSSMSTSLTLLSSSSAAAASSSVPVLGVGTAGSVDFTSPVSSASSTTSVLLKSASSTLSQCVGCGLLINDPFILNVQPNLKWHIRCLNCSKCLRSLMNDSTCFVRDCKAYCREDYFSTFLYRCAGCHRLIDKMDLVFRIRSRTFHLDCFRCVICERLLQPGEEIAYKNEQVYCLLHSQIMNTFSKLDNYNDLNNDNNSNNDGNNDTTNNGNNSSNSVVNNENQINTSQTNTSTSNTNHTSSDNNVHITNLISNNHFMITNTTINSNCNNTQNHTSNNSNNICNMNRLLSEQMKMNLLNNNNNNNTPSKINTTNTTTSNNSSINSSQSKYDNHYNESFISDDMKSLKSDIKGLLPNLLLNQIDDMSLVNMKSVYCSGNNNGNNNNNNSNGMELIHDTEDNIANYENLCNPVNFLSTSTSTSLPCSSSLSSVSTASLTQITFSNGNNNSNNNINGNVNDCVNKLLNQRNSLSNCNNMISGMSENFYPNSPDSSFGAVIQDMDSPMSGSSDELSHEDEDFSLLGMSESNTTGLSECGTAMNGSSSLPINTTGLHHHNHGHHHHHPHHHHHSNNNNNMYGNYNQNLGMLGIGGGSGSLTGSSSSGTSITGGGGLGDEVVHSVVISSRGMTGMHTTGNASSGNGLGGNAGSRPSSGKSAGSKRSKDQKTTRVRTVLNEKQLHTLRTCYAANPRPDALMKEQLVEMTNLSPRVIRVWFQNKRCKDKKRQLLLKQMEQHQQNGGRPGSLHGISMIAQSPVHNDVNLMSTNSGIDVQHIPGPYWSTHNLQNDIITRSNNLLYRSHSPSNLLINQSNKLMRQSIENMSSTSSSSPPPPPPPPPPNSLINNYHTNSLNDAMINYSTGCLINPALTNVIPLQPPPPPPLPPSVSSSTSSSSLSLTGIPSLCTSSTPSCISLSSTSTSPTSLQTFNNFMMNTPSSSLMITNDTSLSTNLSRCNNLLMPSNTVTTNNVNINTTNYTHNSNNINNNNNSGNGTNTNQSDFLNERSAAAAVTAAAPPPPPPPFQHLVRIF